MNSDFLSFRLNPTFLESYSDRTPDWGFPIGGGNTLGELTFLVKYARRKDDGTKERWHETCQRVIEGMYSILKDHCNTNRTPWNEQKAQRSAQDAFERMFTFKWLPPGRGLWMMGTEFVNERKNSASLQNCAYVSTEKISIHSKAEATLPFVRLMEMSMLGVGVGFDTRGANKITLAEPDYDRKEFRVIPDTREGWYESVGDLLWTYFSGGPWLEFDYSQIRPAGELIKGFGGVAAGPGPLIRLHEDLRKLLGGREGELLSSSDIVDINNLIGKCVVSGNVRRSAELALGDADDEAFLDLKNYEVNPERMGADGWGHASNNSVSATVGGNYDHLVDRIVENGEPGLVYLDVCREFGRLADQANNKDHRVMGVNPCLVADATLLTERGLVTFGDAYKSGEKNTLLVDQRVTYEPSEDGEEHPSNWKIDYQRGTRGITQQASEVFLTQRNADVVKLMTDIGFETTLTPDHLVATRRSGMVPAGDLVSGTEILLTAGGLPTASIVGNDPETLEEIEAALMGLLAGDGYFRAGNLTEIAVLCFWGADRDIASRVEGWLRRLWDAYGSTTTCNSNRGYSSFYRSDIPDRNEIRLSSSFLAAHLKAKYGFSRETKLTVPVAIMENARTSVGHFYLAGLFFCDGTINDNREQKAGDASIRLASVNRPLLVNVQRMLLANGMESRIYSRREASSKRLPNGKGGMSDYECKELFEVVLMPHKYEYARYIGFLGSYKDERAQTLTPSRKRAGFVARVTSVVPAGNEDVYCLREPVRRILAADGITMRRCAEQTLESYECCTLVESFPIKHDSLDDFRKTLKVAYLYGKAVTLLPTHWPEVNEVMQRNRRIGCSVSGSSQFAETHGWTMLRTWLDEGYNEIVRRDHQYSEWLGVRESIKMTSVKPSGSVSLLAGVTPGVHWPTSDIYIRRMRLSVNDPLVDALRDAGYHAEPDVMNPDFDMVVELPTRGPDVRTEREVSVWEKAALAVAHQRHWADNAVSVTLTFTENERDQIGAVIRAFEGQLKTLSFLPSFEVGAYAQMPYERIDLDTYNEKVDDVSYLDWNRLYDGDSLDAVGEMYCTTDACEIRYEVDNKKD